MENGIPILMRITSNFIQQSDHQDRLFINISSTNWLWQGQTIHLDLFDFQERQFSMRQDDL
jgi:hypothetical protein